MFFQTHTSNVFKVVGIIDSVFCNLVANGEISDVDSKKRNIPLCLYVYEVPEVSVHYLIYTWDDFIQLMARTGLVLTRKKQPLRKVFQHFAATISENTPLVRHGVYFGIYFF